jgi:hypothetical protein
VTPECGATRDNAGAAARQNANARTSEFFILRHKNSRRENVGFDVRSQSHEISIEPRQIGIVAFFSSPHNPMPSPRSLMSVALSRNLAQELISRDPIFSVKILLRAFGSSFAERILKEKYVWCRLSSTSMQLDQVSCRVQGSISILIDAGVQHDKRL